jgi:transcriptional repressor NF-X1
MHSGDLDSIMRGIQSGQSIRIDNFAMKSALYRSLECDEKCAQMARNRVLAEALELTDVDHSPDTVPQYSTFLLEQVRDNQQLVANIENIFKDIIEGNGGKTSHSFKPMKRDHRRIIHELAEYYNLTSTSYDPEPQRNVVVIATKKSSIPCVTLTEHVSTSKHRPIPLPVTLRPDNTAPPDYFNDDDIIIT